ncbi:MAG: hypothetical protein NC177_12430 [Ruminococcus flavefaciens]|nr:hypothetical protein [Ruminococcus flavefaciens]
MNRIINKIIREFFPNCNYELAQMRLIMLYGKAIEKAGSGRLSSLFNEIHEYEKINCRKTIVSLSCRNKITAYDIAADFSNIAFYLAENRYTNGRTSVLAVYLYEVYSEFIKNNDIINFMKNANNLKSISDTIVDFLYAAGKSDMISCRLNTTVR